MGGGGGDSPEYWALMVLSVALIIGHFGGIALDDNALFTGGYQIIKAPFDAAKNLFSGTDAVLMAVVLVLVIAFLFPAFRELSPGLYTYVILAAVIAIVTGMWSF
jgi:hypothetical protein